MANRDRLLHGIHEVSERAGEQDVAAPASRRASREARLHCRGHRERRAEVGRARSRREFFSGSSSGTVSSGHTWTSRARPSTTTRPMAIPRRAVPVPVSGPWCRSSRTWPAAHCRWIETPMARGIALVRPPSDRLAEGIVTYIQRTPVDLALARRQHDAYRDALSAAGWTVREVEPAPAHPDSVFVVLWS